MFRQFAVHCRSPAFLVVCAILLVAAVTLNTATQALRLHFKKEPVPQPRDFHEIPALMGNWLQISQDEKFDKEIQDVLGTDKYVYRDYIDVTDRAVRICSPTSGNGSSKARAKG